MSGLPPQSAEHGVGLLIRTGMRLAITLAALAVPAIAIAAGPDFSGEWSIDLRTAADRKQNVECGHAYFVLNQTRDRIIGDHSMYPVGCGRINEGGDDTVKGVVIGSTAVLIVTSGRNGAIVLGTAELKGNSLHWELKERIQAGEPPADAPLILGKGVLSRSKGGTRNAHNRPSN